jgi:hypothetical protein
MLVKVAVLLQWLRVFVPRGVRNAFFWILHVTIWIHVGFYGALTLVEIWSCNPREKIWNPWIPGTCISIAAVGGTSSIVNVVSDIIILILPHRVIWKLEMPKHRKKAISLLFTCGIL